MKYKTQIALWLALDLLLLCVIGFEGFLLAGRHQEEKQVVDQMEHQVTPAATEAPKPTEEPVVTEEPAVTETPAVTVTPAVTERPDGEQTVPETNLADLQEQLAAQKYPYQEYTSIYVKDLNGGGQAELISVPQQKAASLIKLYVMAAVYQSIENGTLEETLEIQDLLRAMITVSHNESTNELVRRLSPDGTDWEAGSAVVNAYIKEHGYEDTYMGRDVRDHREIPATGENYTSVSDCGKILEEIYRGECVSPEASAKMLELLKQQQKIQKIPAGVGPVLYTANKTGEISGVENDVAIIQVDEDTAYILGVMTSEADDNGTAASHVTDVSRTVYEYFVNDN